MNFRGCSDLMTPNELCETFPRVKKMLNWVPVKVGMFLTYKLVHGFKSVQEKRSMIVELSFLELEQFALRNKRISREHDYEEEDDPEHGKRFYTISELFKKYSFVKDSYNWNIPAIGMFFNSHLLRGYISKKQSHQIMILEESFLELLEYVKGIAHNK